MLHKALEQFLADVYWGEPDYLVVDMPPGTGDVALSIGAVPARVRGLRRHHTRSPPPSGWRSAPLHGPRSSNLPVSGVIENMSWFTGDDGTRYEIFGAGGGAQLAEELGVPLLGQIPLVPELREGGDIGRPITVTDPEGAVAAVFHDIAEQLDTALKPKRIYNPELKLS